MLTGEIRKLGFLLAVPLKLSLTVSLLNRMGARLSFPLIHSTVDQLHVAVGFANP